MTKKIIAIFSSVLLLAGSALPVFADSTITITGNGTGSTNTTTVASQQATVVDQSNSSTINNDVNSSSNSGGNTSSYNTGGGVSIETGSAKTQTTISNTTNSNVANVDNCNCGTGNTDLKISGNGADTKNTIGAVLQNQTDLKQTNSADVNNDVNATSNTGENNANSNTGGGVVVMTGDATTKVDLMTSANQNLAGLGGGQGNGSSASVLISGNGSGSKNLVNLGLTDYVKVSQNNSANVDNDVFAKSNSGKNSANYNTGGGLLSDVTIATGNATTDVSADTAVNFNQAEVNCDCLFGVNAKIADNGAGETYNAILADISNAQIVGQKNSGKGILNDLNGSSKTGYNLANQNTGDPGVDPSIMTGDSTSTTEVSNQSGANVYGHDSISPFPWDWSNSNITLSFSLQDLLLALGLH